eukprot:3522236-Pyramimonas_sp.AAC.1
MAARAAGQVDLRRGRRPLHQRHQPVVGKEASSAQLRGLAGPPAERARRPMASRRHQLRAAAEVGRPRTALIE